MKTSPHSGVTLMEMLVTMSVLALLSALLLVALPQMRERSETSRCVSRLRQIGSAITLYASEHQGFLPSGWSPQQGTLITGLMPYLGPMKEAQIAPDVFYCPTNERLGSPPAEGFPTGAFKRYKGFSGYFINYVINASVLPIQGLPEPGQPEPRYRYRLSEVRIPTKTVMLLDMRTRAPGVTAPPSSTLARATYFDPSHAQFSLGLVHGGRGNILFVDGHVESFDGSRPLPVQSFPDRATTWW